MIKVVSFCFAFVAFFYSLFAQTENASINPDGMHQKILDSNNKEIGLLLIYEKKKKIYMAISLYNGLISAESDEQKQMEELLIKTYKEQIDPAGGKIIKRIYSVTKNTREKVFIGLCFKRK